MFQKYCYIEKFHLLLFVFVVLLMACSKGERMRQKLVLLQGKTS